MIQSKQKRRKKKKIETSKIVLLFMIIMCFEIIIFSEFMMFFTKDLSALYILIGVPVSLIPVILGYYYKSGKENMAGGIVYDSALSEQCAQCEEDISNE